MKHAALYGLKRGLVQAAMFVGCLYLIKAGFALGRWTFLAVHGGGDVWLGF